jgi:hypothetical protein
MNNILNELNNIVVLSWGELRNKEEIEKICGCIVEAQKEEWTDKREFFYKYAKEINKKYILLIDDKFELLYPQIYILQTLSIFKENPIISFIYTDLIKDKIIFFPSFKPYIGNAKIFMDNIPVIIESNCIELFKIKENFNIKLLSENKIGYHLAEPSFKYYE